MIRTELCDYSGAYIFSSGIINVAGVGDDDSAKWTEEIYKGVIFKNWAPFTNCISSINNIQIDNAEYIDVVMPMYNLTEYSDNIPKTSGSLCQYYRDDPNDKITQS